MESTFACDHHDFLEELISELSIELNRPIRNLKRLIFERQNPHYCEKLWKKIDENLPGHDFEYVGQHPETERYELRRTSPLIEALLSPPDLDKMCHEDGFYGYYYFCPECRSIECSCSP